MPGRCRTILFVPRGILYSLWRCTISIFFILRISRHILATRKMT
ncbi:hypothetical protein ACHAXS_004135 [Conticribra weissflogii]